MQAFFLKVYEQVKSRLCERRNNRASLNRYAVMQRTDVMQRKSNQIPARRIQIIDLQNIRMSNKISSISKQQQDNHKRHQQRIKGQSSEYTIQFKDNQKQIDFTSDQIQRQKGVGCQISVDNYYRDILKTYQKIKFLEEKDEQRKKNYWRHMYQNYTNGQIDRQLSDLVSQDQQDQAYQNLDRDTLEIAYRSDIIQTRQQKYSYQLADYPDISFQSYCSIRNLWIMSRKHPNQVIKQMKLKILDKLLARSLKTLSFGSWLNDQIINGYLQMVENKAFQVGKNYKILNSFFAETTFSKSNEMISRALKRKRISQQNVIVIAINNGNHWFFAKIKNSKVMIYDSIQKDLGYYQTSQSTKDIFSNVIRFADWFYGSRHILEVCSNYPQQQNSYDCGMFLLCGIKDVIRDYQEWAFSQQDINFKRIQIAQQFVNEEVHGFQI